MKKILCLAASAVVCSIASGQANMSVLEQEIAQAVAMVTTLDAYHDTGSKTFQKPIRVVYFCPKDIDPFDYYQSRIERIMQDLKEFLEQEMVRNGFKEKSLNLERVDKRLKIHRVRSLKETADYSYTSGNAIKQEVAAEFQRRQIQFDEEHVLIFCALAEVTKPYTVRLYAPFYGLGANQAKGLCFVADCPWLDTQHFSNTDTEIRITEHSAQRRMKLGMFNTIYIGGTVHELGHGMTLPHNRERRFEKPVLGTALMGAGNYTYRQELRDEGKGTFLTFASATRLASLGLFNKRVKGLNQTPSCELEAMSFEYEAGTISVKGRVETDVPAYAVVAYNDPEGDSDYDAVPWTCAVKPDGTFSVAVQELKPGTLELRLVVCHVNGAVSSFPAPYTCPQDGVPDLERLNVPWILREPLVAYTEGNFSAAESKAKKLLAQHGRSELTSRYLNHLIALCSKDGSYEHPAILNSRQKRAILSDSQWKSARVGWCRPTRNEYCRERKGDPRVFLEIGDAFHSKGLYAHSPSSYVFDLGGKWKTFKTAYGLQRGASGKVIFVVLADGTERFRSDVIEASEERMIELDVRGVKSLELVVENGGEGNGNCWSVWGSSELSR